MSAVLLDLTAPTVDDNEVRIVEDLETLSADGRCSCAASDDNPY